MVYYLFCPSSVNLYFVKGSSNYIVMVYGSRYFCSTIGHNFLISSNSEFRTVSIRVINGLEVYKKAFKSLNCFIFSWVSFISKKIKFKHKGAWISTINSKTKLLILNFRLAHLAYLFNQSAMLRRRKKHFSFHTLLCLGYNTQNLMLLSRTIYNFFRLNKFTFRGIKFSRQRLIKKEGKISKYMIDLKK